MRPTAGADGVIGALDAWAELTGGAVITGVGGAGVAFATGLGVGDVVTGSSPSHHGSAVQGHGLGAWWCMELGIGRDHRSRLKSTSLLQLDGHRFRHSPLYTTKHPKP